MNFQKSGLVRKTDSTEVEDSELKKSVEISTKTIQASNNREYRAGIQSLELEWEEGWKNLWYTWLKDFYLVVYVV